MMLDQKRKAELTCLALTAAGINMPFVVDDDGNLKEVSEIEKVTQKFENPKIIEVQCWNKSTALHFAALGYETIQSNDGSWWIEDGSRLWA